MGGAGLLVWGAGFLVPSGTGRAELMVTLLALPNGAVKPITRLHAPSSAPA